MSIETTNKMPLASALSRATLPDQVAKHLLQHIMDSDLKPGDLLPPMSALTKQYGVSLPVIREALKSLSALGLITLVKGKGALIKPIGDELLRHFFSRAAYLETEPLTHLIEVRIPLEMQSASLAAQRRTDRDLSRLEQLISEMQNSLNQAEQYVQLDAQFHLAIAYAAHNLMLYYLLSSIRTSLESSMVSIRKAREAEGRIGFEQAAHQSILTAIKLGQPEEASANMQHHLDETATLIRQIEGSVKLSQPGHAEMAPSA